MSRALRKAAIPKLPDGVKWATQVPMLVIPSAGHSQKGDGADGGLRRRPTGEREVEVRVRYPACCDQHKGSLKVESLATPSELQALCSRFSQHHGHGQLLPGRTKIEFAPCTDKVPCEDCMMDAEEKRAQ
jgi:hypothetical protein